MVFHTIRSILDHTESIYGAEDAIRYKIKKNEITSKTYAQLKQDSESFSAALKVLGQKEKHVAIIGATSYEWLTAFFGAVDGGSIAVPLDASLPAVELFELINRADVSTLVLDEVRADLIATLKENCPHLENLILMHQEKSDEKSLSFQQLVREHPEGFDYTPDPEDLAVIMFTSGTTGKSKGVMLTQRNLAENATCLEMGIKPRTVILTVLPIHHAYCLSMDILKAVSLGSVICINDSLMRMQKNCRLFQPEMILMVPMMIETMAKKMEDLKDQPHDAVRKAIFGEKLHTICSGGAYLDPSYIDLFAQYGIVIQQGYGMTECSPVISTNQRWDIRKDTVGQLLPNCEAKSVDGELWVRGSSVMKGYYQMPKETAETLQDGWLKTGDLGYVDEDRFVHLTGRKKNLIITKNGENVSPEELENKLALSRLVAEVLVREDEGQIEAEIFPDFEYAKRQGVTDIKVALQKLIDDCNRTSAPYKRIYKLKIRDREFEKNASKKIIRY